MNSYTVIVSFHNSEGKVLNVKQVFCYCDLEALDETIETTESVPPGGCISYTAFQDGKVARQNSIPASLFWG